eukprot:3780299-Lingulodinium_polyedra.AAC.1
MVRIGVDDVEVKVVDVDGWRVVDGPVSPDDLLSQLAIVFQSYDQHPDHSKVFVDNGGTISVRNHVGLD